MALNVAKGISHLDHLEDLVLLYGKDGAKLASDTIDRFLKRFENLADDSADLTISEKIDGAPSLYFGTAPDGRFFVGTKGVLSKKEQKISYNLQDIRKNYPESGVKDVLAKAFNALKPAFKEKGFACQGDLLWSDKSQKSDSEIEGKRYLTFRPNTILYGIPVDPKSKIFKDANRAILGIVVHGVYETNFVDGDRIEFNRKDRNLVREFADKLSTHPNIFCIHPFIDNIEAMKDSNDILQEIAETLKSINETQKEIDQNFDREWKIGEEPYIKMAKVYLPQFINQQVRSSVDTETILTARDEKEFLKKFKKDFESFVSVKAKTEVGKMKSLQGREQKARSFKEFLNWMKEVHKTFEPMFICFFRLYNIKVLIIQLLDKLEKKLGDTFIIDRKDDFTVKAVKPEGYVFLAGDNMVKIVDRLEFSKNNMLYSKFAEEKESSKQQVLYEKTIEDEIEEDVISALSSLKEINDGFNDNQIMEAANKMKDYVAIYVGRFQPPTIAHVKNIEDLSRLFKEVYVVISKAENKTPKYVYNNPLTNDEREKLLETDPKIRNLNNIHISSGQTFKYYGIHATSKETGESLEVEVKKELGIDPKSVLVIALGKEDERYFASLETGKFFNINKGEVPDKKRRIGLYGIKLMGGGKNGKVSATDIRNAILSGELGVAEQYMAGSDAIKSSIMDIIGERLEMAAKSKGMKTTTEAIKKLNEEIEEEYQLDEAFDIVLDILEEE